MILRLMIALSMLAFADQASAQFQIRIGNGGINLGTRGVSQPHIDHHDHVIRDSHGHRVGVEHHDVIRGGSSRNRTRSGSGSHIDHHDHVIRDSHGHIVGREHHDVIHSNRSYVVPRSIGGRGQYYVQGNKYYYLPQSSNSHVVARPTVMAYGGFTQYHDLAGELEFLINELLLDFHYNYSHNVGFAETYAEGYQLLGVAKYIHAADHNHDHDAVRSRLSGMDRLFHHIEDDIRGWSRHQHRQIGNLGIVAKAERIEATLHHLMNDVGVSATEQAPPPGGGIEQAPAPQGFAPAPQGNGSAPLGNSPPPATLQ
ncbi:hypothetical protein Pla52o_53190 [Novipirellula galeiformis]|uniref:Uncharacterized protein n=1 Tax=Novipirellula galeiformis TaxID=2528004 RepID=A0A5C6BYE9_9BACT|nr:hypothetical protein [Novipirellula galeiformis]TWU17313.1 hypothetical protein Pla52o_53190 [Novipirellula galeiformis]